MARIFSSLLEGIKVDYKVTVLILKSTSTSLPGILYNCNCVATCMIYV